jgi:hypothetical protein
MYHWDRPVPATEDSSENGRGRPAPGGGRAAVRAAGARRAPAAHAVQVALDRRDNGGDSRAQRDQ